MKASIVIPNWNGEGRLAKNIPKVLQVTGVGEVIVVDDLSEDNSIKVLEKDFPEVKLIKKEKNTRFSDTVNIGFDNALGDLVFLLNNDAAPSQDALEKTLVHFKNPKVFSVSCNVGGSWSWAKFEKGFFWHYMNKEEPGGFHQTLWSSGGSGIFRKDIWQDLRGFDLMYSPFYEEDVDIGYRATKRGYINIWEPKSNVEHYKEKGVNQEHFSSQFISRVAERNQLMFIWKNITSRKLIKEHKKALVTMLLTHPKYWQTFLTAALNLANILEKRKVEIKASKLSDEEILGKFQ